VSFVEWNDPARRLLQTQKQKAHKAQAHQTAMYSASTKTPQPLSWGQYRMEGFTDGILSPPSKTNDGSEIRIYRWWVHTPDGGVHKHSGPGPLRGHEIDE
jgi:hypothetical protein